MSTPAGADRSAYGDTFADVYDEWYDDDPTPVVSALTRLAPGRGRLLELGAGTGRLALPLAREGFEVTALDGSAAMLSALADKDGSGAVSTVLADLAEPPAGPWDVVVVARNTLFNLSDRDHQARCLTRVAEELAPTGVVVVEAVVVDPDGPRTGLETRHVTDREVTLSAFLHDASTSTVVGQFVTLVDGGAPILRPWRISYLSPDALDEVAAEAGLVLDRRWSDWSGAAPGPGDHEHVTVYRARDPAKPG